MFVPCQSLSGSQLSSFSASVWREVFETALFEQIFCLSNRVVTARCYPELGATLMNGVAWAIRLVRVAA